jgi:hypothetical protein
MLSPPSSEYSFSTHQNEFGSVASTIPPPEIRIGNKIILNKKTGKTRPKPPSITESTEMTPSTPAPPSVSSSQRTPPGAFDVSETSSTRNRRIEQLNEEDVAGNQELEARRQYEGLTYFELDRYAQVNNIPQNVALQLLKKRLKDRKIEENADIQIKARAALDILARAEKTSKKKSK